MAKAQVSLHGSTWLHGTLSNLLNWIAEDKGELSLGDAAMLFGPAIKG